MPLHSIVIPVFNEVKGLNALVERLQRVIESIGDPCEVILVNDGSRDGSGALLEEIHKRDERFKIVHFSRNFGHQVAISAGTQFASGHTVTVMDSDLQDPPELILKFLERWKEGYEIVYSVRRKRVGETYFKLLTASIFYRMLRSLTDLEIPADAGDFRLIDRKVADAFLSIPERNRYIRGLIGWMGYKQIAVEYDRDVRAAGVTHFPLRKMLKFAFDGITSFSLMPLRLATWLGFVTSGVAFVGILVALYLRFMTAVTIHGWSSQILVSLFLGGVQLLALGIIGEYLGRIYDEVRKRPLFLVSKLTGFRATGAERTPQINQAAS